MVVDFADTAEMAAFRTEVRSFIEQHYPADLLEEARSGNAIEGETGNTPNPTPEEVALEQKLEPWKQALAQKGWIAAAFPKELGGAALTPMEQYVLNAEFARAGVRRVQIRADLASVLLMSGTEEQKKQHLPGLISAEVRWAQGYSEPGAGSDLASLQTRAIRDGDEFVVNGQKIWTSNARRSQWLFGLFRTDPDAPKHRGISYLLMDLKTPGITIRPMQQMTDAWGFNEVFFEDVRVPVKNVVGEMNRGWYIGATLLDFERSNIGDAVGTVRTLDHLRGLLVDEQRKGSGRSRLNRPAIRAELTDRYVEANVAGLFSQRVMTIQNRGMVPNYEASVAKVFSTELNRTIGNTAVKSLGLHGYLWGREPLAPANGRWSHMYLGATSMTIGGGTSEIQRNIIATRGLGLPRG